MLIISVGIALSVVALVFGFFFAVFRDCDGYASDSGAWICQGAAGTTLPIFEWLLVVTAAFAPAAGAIITARGGGGKPMVLGVALGAAALGLVLLLATGQETTLN